MGAVLKSRPRGTTLPTLIIGFTETVHYIRCKSMNVRSFSADKMFEEDNSIKKKIFVFLLTFF